MFGFFLWCHENEKINENEKKISQCICVISLFLDASEELLTEFLQYIMCWVHICLHQQSEWIDLTVNWVRPQTCADKTDLSTDMSEWVPACSGNTAMAEAFGGAAGRLAGCTARCQSQNPQAWISPHKKKPPRLWLPSKSVDKRQGWIQVFFPPHGPSPPPQKQEQTHFQCEKGKSSTPPPPHAHTLPHSKLLAAGYLPL